MKRLTRWFATFDGEDWASLFGLTLLGAGIGCISVPWALIVVGSLVFLSVWAGPLADLVSRARRPAKTKR